MIFLSILLGIILFILGGIHINWVFGGTFGFAESLPTDENGKRLLNPKPFDSVVVATGLILFGLYYIIQSGLFGFHLPAGLLKYGGWIIPIIFLVRAIGDFRYIGFFKKLNTTEFGRRDSNLFSPLCLVIASIGIAIQFLN